MGWRKRHDYGEEILQVFQEIGEIVMIRAWNNFQIVSGHDDWPNSFLLGHVLFLAGQMYMMIALLGAHKPKMLRIYFARVIAKSL